MAVIKYDDIFDFPGYNKAIKDLEAANKDFGKTVTTINDRIAAQYKEIKGDLKAYSDVLKSFNVNQRGATDALIQTGEAAVGTKKKLAEQKRIMEELLNVQDLSVRSLTELKTAGKGIETQYSNLKGASDDVIAKKKALAEEYRRVTGAAKEQARALKSTSTVLDVAEGSYAALQKELTAIGNQLKSIPNAFDKATGKININNKAAVDLSRRYLEVNNVLKAADAQLGNYQRNVGNYASATHSLSQVLRELPSLGISTQQFFLAISNNLPILFDQYSALSKKIDENTGKVIGNSGAFKIFASSIFSIGNLLTIGVTLLSVYGSELVEWAGSLFDVSDAFDEAKEAAKAYARAVEDVNKAAISNQAADVTKLELYRDIIVDTTRSQKDRNEALKAYNQLADEANKLDQSQIDNIELVNEKIGQQIVLIERRAFSRAAESILADRAEKLLLAREDARLKAEKQLEREIKAGNTIVDAKAAQNEYVIGLERKRVIEQKIAVDENVKNAKREFDESKKALYALIELEGFATDEIKSKQGERAKDLIKAQQDLLKAIAEQAIALADLHRERGLIDEEDFQIAKLGIIKQYADAAIELEKTRKGGADKKALADFTKERIEAERNYEAFVNKSEKEALERKKALIESEAADKILAAKQDSELILSSKFFTDTERKALEIEYQNQVDRILIDSLEKRILLEADAAKRAALERQKAELELGIGKRNTGFDRETTEKEFSDRIEAQKKAFDIIRAMRDTSWADEVNQIKKLQQIYEEAQKAGVDVTKESEEAKYALKLLYAEKERLLREELEQTIQLAISTGLEIAQNLINDSFESRIASLEAEKQKELELAGNNAAAREAIEERFNKKIAEQKNKQARADKAFALFNVAINTAQAIAKTISTFGMPAAIPFIALAAIQGALQAAVIASRPIPKYKKGRKGGPAEMAIVNEEGPELIIDKHGKLREVGGKPSVTYLNEGDSVITARETERILKMSAITNETEITTRLSGGFKSGKQDEMVHIMKLALSGNQNMEAAFKKAVKEIPIFQTIIDEQGQRQREKRINSTTTYLNNLTKL